MISAAAVLAAPHVLYLGVRSPILAQTPPPELPPWITASGTAGMILLLSWLVWALMNRKIMTRGTYDEKVEEAKEWRAAYTASERAREEERRLRELQTQSLDDLLEHSRQSLDILQSFEPPREPRPRTRRGSGT